MTRSQRRPSGSPAVLALLLLVSLLVPAVATRAAALDHGLADSTGISGTVTDAQGRPLPGIEVTVSVYVPHRMWPYMATVGRATTGSTGTYRTVVLQELPGEQWVCFADPSGTYAGECYDDVAPSGHPTHGTSVHDGQGGVDAVLHPPATLTGRVTSADGAPVENAWVRAMWSTPSSAYWLPEVRTDADGRYTLAGLKPGTYRMVFWDPRSPYFPFDDENPDRVGPLELSPGQVVTVDEVIGPDVKALTGPVIVGPARVGQPLTASGDSWTPEGAMVTYRWVVGSDSVPEDDPLGPTYVPTRADVGRTIRVLATASHPGMAAGSAWSRPTAAVEPASTPPGPASHVAVVATLRRTSFRPARRLFTAVVRSERHVPSAGEVTVPVRWRLKVGPRTVRALTQRWDERDRLVTRLPLRRGPRTYRIRVFKNARVVFDRRYTVPGRSSRSSSGAVVRRP